MTALSINDIKTDGGTQARAGLNRQTVMQYRQIISENSTADNGDYKLWPFADPVVVFHDGENHWLADGFHRVTACREHGKYTVTADIRQGTRRDAVLYAVGANATHGLQRTDDDKRRAVETLLRDEEWGKWSDREIARRARVSHPFVAKIRRELQQGGELETVSSERTYTTRHGTTAVMNTQNIGGNGAGEQPAADPPFQPGDYALISGDGFDLIPARVIKYNPAQESALVEWMESGDGWAGTHTTWIAESQLIKATADACHDRRMALGMETAPERQPEEIVLPEPEPEKLYLDMWHLESWVKEWLIDIQGDGRQLSAMQRGSLDVTGLMMYIEEGLLKDDGPRRHYRKRDLTQAIDNVLKQLRQTDVSDRFTRVSESTSAIRYQVATQIPSGTQSISDEHTADLAAIPHPFAADTLAERINIIIRMAEKIVAQSDDITVTLEMGTAVSHMYAAAAAARSIKVEA